MNPKYTLTRLFEANGGTFGLLLGDNFHCYTMERAWENNKQNISCIPSGEYIGKRDSLGRHKYARIENVTGRSNIEIHPANYPWELMGCIALGQGITIRDNTVCLLYSKIAVEKFINSLKENDTFSLHITKSMEGI